MNNAGIIAQYGFLYQRNAFVLFLLKYLNTQSVYYFEGKTVKTLEAGNNTV